MMDVIVEIALGLVLAGIILSLLWPFATPSFVQEYLEAKIENMRLKNEEKRIELEERKEKLKE